MWDALDYFFRKMSVVVLSIVDFYGRLTDTWHPLLAIIASVGIFAGIEYFGPAWMFRGVAAIVTIITAAFFATMAYLFAYCMTLPRD